MSRKTLNFVSGIIRRHRISTGPAWRKLNPGQQALLVLACLRKGETSAGLAAEECRAACVVIDGTLIPIGRAADRPSYSGKHKLHGMKPESQEQADKAHAQLRSPGERANAQLKTWKILTRLRCCPRRAGQLAKAIHVLQIREA